MIKIKTLLLVAALAVALAPTVEAAPALPADDLYAAGQFSIAPFAVARIVDSKEDFGGGLIAGYSLTRQLTLEAEALTYEVDDSHWDDAVKEAGAGLKLAFPIKATGFAPYLTGGYKRDLIEHENRLAAGGGVEWRSGQLGIFADARVNHGFEQELDELGNDVEVRVGISYRFK